jgi:hypothetical protein
MDFNKIICLHLQLMQKGGMDVIDCNNHVKSAIKYFGPSCAVNSLIDKYNPIGMYMQMRVSLFHIILNVLIFFPRLIMQPKTLTYTAYKHYSLKLMN